MEGIVTRSTFALLALFLVQGSPSAADQEKWNRYKEAVVKITTDSEYTKLWPEHIKQFKSIEDFAFPKSPPQTNNFPCNTYSSPQVPTSVHNLQPGDFKVIGALGDSITAGNGVNANTPIEVLNEYRGHSWTIGGVGNYEEVLTLPNILKKYNPGITGFSTGTGNRGSSVARLNVAFPGNVAENMPEQATMLVDRISDLDGVNFQNDWKIVTLFIGGNDLCYYCRDQSRYSVEKYRGYIQEALDRLKANLPRTFVNVVSIFDLSTVSELPNNNIICQAVHAAICSCPSQAPEQVRQTAMQYSEAVENLISSNRYNDKDDFTVVFQPFMRDNDLPRLGNGQPDLSYFSPDCFHFSSIGHESITKMLWNGMFEPVGSKKTSSPFQQNLYCPQQGEYIPTSQNTRLSEDEIAQVQNIKASGAAQTPEFPPSTSPANLPLILGVTCFVGILATVVLAAVVVYKKRRTPMEDLTDLVY